jgi:hypothetical protein
MRFAQHSSLKAPSLLRRVCSRAGGLALTVALAACRPSLTTDALLTSGKSVGGLLDAQRPTAVLLYDPRDCVACGTTLDEWRRVQATDLIKVVVLLDRPPSREEQSALDVQHVSVTGVLEVPSFSPRPLSPQEALFQSGVRTVWATGKPTVAKPWSNTLLTAVQFVRQNGNHGFASHIPVTAFRSSP